MENKQNLLGFGARRLQYCEVGSGAARSELKRYWSCDLGIRDIVGAVRQSHSTRGSSSGYCGWEKSWVMVVVREPGAVRV